MTNEELDELCDTCPHKDMINEYGDCSAPSSFSCPQIEAYVREEKEKKMSFMSELLSRCENSDDADKKELAVYVNKLDAIRDSLEKQLWLSKNETMRAQNTMAAMKVKLNELKARIGEEDAELHKADDEIDELHEKYRWRKQSEEPISTTDTKKKYLIVVHDSSGSYALSGYVEADSEYEGEYIFYSESLGYVDNINEIDFWRPLDLPEEESK